MNGVDWNVMIDHTVILSCVCTSPDMIERDRFQYRHSFFLLRIHYRSILAECIFYLFTFPKEWTVMDEPLIPVIFFEILDRSMVLRTRI